MTVARRTVTLSMCMVAASAVAAGLRPSIYLTDLRPKFSLETLFPSIFRKWAVDAGMPIIAPSPDVQAKLNSLYNQTLSRTYINDDGRRIMLSVAYGGDQSDGTRLHLPEVCYPAQGFEIVSRRDDHLGILEQSIPVRLLVAKLGGRVEPITYWMVVGEQAVRPGMHQKLAQMSYGVKRVIPDGLLTRVSSISSDVNKDFSLHRSFVADLAASMAESNWKRVAGVS